MMSVASLDDTAPLVDPRQSPIVRVLAHVFADSDPDLWAPGLLPGETLPDAAARREAAADILDDLLAEIAAETWFIWGARIHG